MSANSDPTQGSSCAIITYIPEDILCLCSRTGTASTTMNKKKGKLATGFNQKWIIFIRKIMFCFFNDPTAVDILCLQNQIQTQTTLRSSPALRDFFSQNNFQIYCDLVQFTHLN